MYQTELWLPESRNRTFSHMFSKVSCSLQTNRKQMQRQVTEEGEDCTASILEHGENECISVKVDAPDTFVSHFKVLFAF